MALLALKSAFFYVSVLLKLASTEFHSYFGREDTDRGRDLEVSLPPVSKPEAKETGLFRIL